jgi:hypothetical protein
MTKPDWEININNFAENVTKKYGKGELAMLDDDD